MYMEFLYFLLLGIVQGLTEFLPVSSSGHLVLLDRIFNIDTGNFLFVSILLHIATLFSVVILYRKEIWELIKHPFCEKSYFLIISTLLTAIVVLLFKSFFEEMFLGKFLPIFFMTTAILLMVTFFMSKKESTKKMTYKSAMLTGLVQGIAVIPGISRSGSTICFNTLTGTSTQEATSYSFVLSIPIILGSLCFEIADCFSMQKVFFSGSIFYLIMSFIVAFVFGIFAIKIMKKVAKTKRYYIFSIYLVIISIVSLFLV